MVKVAKNFSEGVTYFGYTREACKKFLERVLPARDCEKPNIELVLKTTLSNIQNHDIVKITT